MSDNCVDRPALRPVARNVLASVLLTQPAVETAAPAAQVIQMVTALSRQWLCAAPLRTHWLDPTASAVAAGAALAATAQELAEEATIQEMRRAGLTPRFANRLDLWLLLDLAGQTPVVLRRRRKPAAANGRHQRQDHASPGDATTAAPADTDGQTWLRRALQQAKEALYHAGRWQLALHVVLLCEPSRQAEAAAWLTGLTSLGVESVYLAGPVDADYVRRTVWVEPLAQALTVLLWSDLAVAPRGFPPLRQPTRPGCWAYALGGNGWAAPRRAIQQWLGLAAVRQAVAGLLATNPMLPPLPALNLDEWLLDLAHRVPPPLASIQISGGRAVRDHRLLQAAADHAAQRRPAQQRARQEWMRRQRAAWQTSLAALQSAAWEPDADWPAPTAYQRRLAAQLAEFDQATAALGDQIAALTVQQQRLSEQMATALPFAPRRTGGSDAVFSHPYAALQALWARMGAWLHRWRQGQNANRALVEQLLRQQQHAWQIENLTCVRDLLAEQTRIFAAGLQAVNRLLDRLAALETDAARLQNDCAPAVAPWPVAKLTALAQQTFDDGLGFVRAALERHPLRDWADPDLSQLRDELLAEAAGWLSPLTDAPAADLLAQALDDEALLAWLDEWTAASLPRWPPQALEPAALVQDWLLTPHPAGRRTPGRSSPAARSAGLSAAERATPALPPPRQELSGQLIARILPPDPEILVADDTPHASSGLVQSLDPQITWKGGDTVLDGLWCVRLALVDLAAPA